MADSDAIRAVDPGGLDEVAVAQAEVEIVLRRVLDSWAKMGYLDAPEPVRSSIAAEGAVSLRLTLKRLYFAAYCRAREQDTPTNAHSAPTRPPPAIGGPRDP